MIECDTIAALEDRMSDKNIAEAQRICRECGIAARWTLEASIVVELYFPQRSPSGIYIEEIALLIEG